jgi:orotate phosphoribosyltransferase-like protein
MPRLAKFLPAKVPINLEWRQMMNKFIKTAALCFVSAGGSLLVQGCTETTLAVQQKNADITIAYRAITNSKNQQETIAMLVAEGKNPDMVASVATVAGVPLATIEAAMPGIPQDQLFADATAAQNDPVAYSPSAASGVRQSDSSVSSKGPRSLRTSF